MLHHFDDTLAHPPSGLVLQPPGRTTYTYKRVGDLEIHADVYRPDDGTTRPVAVWIHGGALIMGNRGWIDRRAKDLLLDAGYAVVSIDYRLAPDTLLPDIIEDLEDAFAWIEREGPRLFNVDVRRVAVLGGSAGGYLTLTAGFRARPRPAVLVSFFGYGDLVADWYSKPSPHQRHHQISLTREQAFEHVSGPPISDDRNREGNGWAFYQFCRQQGLWPAAVSGLDPHTETDRFYPYMAVQNVTGDYPPTMLIHGTEDTDVPYEQSVMMARELRKHGVEHVLVTIPGAEHGLQDGEPETIDAAYESMLSFVDHHMKREIPD